jgi:hypothetical protein
MPSIGDLIIHKPRGYKGEVYAGVVYKTSYHRDVFIQWSQHNPHYTKEYGFSATNIHNCYDEFEVIKKK